MNKFKLTAVTLAALTIASNNALAQSNVSSLQKEIREIKNSYEQRISDLENRLEKTNTDVSDNKSKLKSNNVRNVYSNKFNPSIGIILNGKYSTFSSNESEFAGFAVGEEGERGSEIFSIPLAATVDSKIVKRRITGR